MTKRLKTPFGQYLVDEIKASGMSQESFYTKVGITKPYFYDLLHSAPPPAQMQMKMISILEAEDGPDIVRRRKFFDLAAQGREEIPADIAALIKADANSWNKVRDVLHSTL